MTRFVRTHRLVLSSAAVVVLVLLGGGALVANAGERSRTGDGGVLGPGRITVRIDIAHSRFVTHTAGRPLRVRPHTDVRFVVVNHDPIGHELIVGGPDVQARHANGHEAYHPPVPGEVSVPANGRASTTYAFHQPGPVEYACHLPGHYQYGMHGIVEVVPDPAERAHHAEPASVGRK